MTVADVIQKFGGYRAMAETFGVVPTAVLNWRKANRLPTRLHYRIAEQAKARRIKIDRALFADAA